MLNTEYKGVTVKLIEYLKDEISKLDFKWTNQQQDAAMNILSEYENRLRVL